jgi:hypothetical protein
MLGTRFAWRIFASGNRVSSEMASAAVTALVSDHDGLGAQWVAGAHELATYCANGVSTTYV